MASRRIRLGSLVRRLFRHVEVVPDGETIELTLPKWNEWYWVSGSLDADDELVLSLWLRHEK